MRSPYLWVLIAFNLFWALSLSVVQELSKSLDYGGIVTLRFGMAGLGLLLLWPLLPGRIPRRGDLVRTAVMGVIVFVIGQRLQVLGNKLSTAANSSVLMGLEPLLCSVAAALFLREHITVRRWAGFGLGILGVVFLHGVWRADFKFTSLTASLIFISSFLCETVYSVMGKPLIERAGMAKVLTLALVSGTSINLLCEGQATLETVRHLSLSAWLWLAYLAVICTMVGYTLWFVVIRQTDVNVAAMTIFVQPVAGILIAWLWLKEPLHWGQLWGSVAIVGGLIVGLWKEHPAAESTGRRHAGQSEVCVLPVGEVDGVD
jgi:drug/metabolite transporter (DMT)-like permease